MKGPMTITFISMEAGFVFEYLSGVDFSVPGTSILDLHIYLHSKNANRTVLQKGMDR